MVTNAEQNLLNSLAAYVDERTAGTVSPIEPPITTNPRPPDEREALVVGKYKPDKNNSGIPLAEWQHMQDWNPSDTQQVYINEPLVLDHRYIHGQIKFGPNGTLRGRYMALDGPEDPNSIVFSGETAVLDCDRPPGSLGELRDSIIYMKRPHPKFNGFKGAGMTFIRTQIAWVTDCWGPYTKQGQTWDTNVKMLGCLGSHTVYWPGLYFADRNPKYWDGTGWNAESTKTIKRNIAGGVFWDPVHKDGTHNDICEIHSARGSHRWVGDHYEGTGILIDGSVLYSIDAYGEGNPFAVPLKVPYLGAGDNPKRGLDGGQHPDHRLPYTSWNKPMANGKYAANGVGLYIGQVTGELFSSPTAVATLRNWIDGGNMGMQEQDKGLPKIEFIHQDNIYGPNYYRWASDNTRDVYTVRINDYLVQDAMPDFSKAPVIIPNHPVNGSPPFGPGGNNKWEDGTPVGLGSSTKAGLRVR